MVAIPETSRSPSGQRWVLVYAPAKGNVKRGQCEYTVLSVSANHMKQRMAQDTTIRSALGI